MRSFVFALLAAASFSAAAGSVDLNLSNHSIEAKFYANAGAAHWTFAGLYNRDTKDRALNVGLLATGDTAIGNSRFEGGLGGKLYSVTVGNGDVLPLAPGAQVPWFPRTWPLPLATYASYPPHSATLLTRHP